MNRSLLLNGLILGTLLCTGTITARAVDADVQSGIAAAAPRETRAQAVHSTWRDRTDIAVGVQTGSSSEGHESLFPTDDHNQFYRQKKDYGHLTKMPKVLYLYKGASVVAVKKSDLTGCEAIFFPKR